MQSIEIAGFNKSELKRRQHAISSVKDSTKQSSHDENKTFSSNNNNS